MGFKKDAYATVWSTEVISDTLTKCKLSINRKNRQTNEYETDFSGFVKFYGTANAQKASKLNARDRIRLGDVDVSNRYDKEKKVEYIDYKVFNFETLEQNNNAESVASNKIEAASEGEPENSGLPF